MKTYLITLDKNYSSTKKYSELIKTGLDIEIVPGVIPSPEIMKNYRFRPKSVIGGTLAHKNVWEIVSKGDSKALILEDDVIPLFTNSEEIDNLKVPKDGILKLHTECMTGIKDSGAAYILSSLAAKKVLSNYKMYIGYFDWDMYFNAKNNNIKVEATKSNMFLTDETKSLCRGSNNNILYDFIDTVFPLSSRSQKTRKMIFDYKIIRFNNTEISSNQIVYLVVIIVLLKLSLKNYKYLVLLVLFSIFILGY